MVTAKKPRAKKVKEVAAPVVEYVPVDLGAIVDKQIKAARTKLHKKIDAVCTKALADLGLV